MPPPTLQVTPSPDIQAELERRYQATRHAPSRTRHQIVLLSAQGHTPPHPRSPCWCAATPIPSAGCSEATCPVAQTRCRTGLTLASRPATRPPSRPGWSGWQIWIGVSQMSTCELRERVDAAQAGCWPVGRTEPS